MCFGDTSSEESTCQCRACKGCEFRSLGWEDPLEEVVASHSSNLAWRITWTEESGRLQSIALQGVRHDLNDLAQHSAVQHTVTCIQEVSSVILKEGQIYPLANIWQCLFTSWLLHLGRSAMPCSGQRPRMLLNILNNSPLRQSHPAQNVNSARLINA